MFYFPGYIILTEKTVRINNGLYQQYFLLTIHKLSQFDKSRDSDSERAHC